MKVFFYVQHLLGIGHLKRAATLAQRCATAGLEVTCWRAAAAGRRPFAVTCSCRRRAPRCQLQDAARCRRPARSTTPGSRRRAPRCSMPGARRRRCAAHRALPVRAPRRCASSCCRCLEARGASRRGPLIVCSVRDLLQPRPDREAATVRSGPALLRPRAGARRSRARALRRHVRRCRAARRAPALHRLRRCAGAARQRSRMARWWSRRAAARSAGAFSRPRLPRAADAAARRPVAAARRHQCRRCRLSRARTQRAAPA